MQRLEAMRRFHGEFTFALQELAYFKAANRGSPSHLDNYSCRIGSTKFTVYLRMNEFLKDIAANLLYRKETAIRSTCHGKNVKPSSV